MDYDSFRNEIQIPPVLKKPFQMLVKAGMTLLFGDKGNPELNRSLAKGATGSAIGRAVGGAMMLVISKIKKLPSGAVLPATVELVFHVCEYAEKSGETIDKNTLAEAVAMAVTVVTKHLSKSMPKPQQQQPAGLLAQGA